MSSMPSEATNWSRGMSRAAPSPSIFVGPRDGKLPRGFGSRAGSSQPDVIVTTGTPGSLAAKRATSTIPIVFASSGNPVAAYPSPAFHGQVATSQGSPFPDLSWKASVSSC